MRVLMVAVDFPALSETFVLDQITGLLDRGFDVDILACRARDDATVHPDIDSYGLIDHVHYVRPIPPTGYRVTRWLRLLLRLAGQGKFRLAREAMKLGWARALKRPTFSGALQIVAYARTMEDLPAPDVVVCHFGPTGDLMVRLRRALGARWPVATFFHGHDVSSALKEKGRAAYRLLLSDGDLFLPASNLFRDRLVDIGAPPTRTTVHRMGVRLDRLGSSPAAGRNDRSDWFSFVSVGRLVEKKGLEYLVRALALCREREPDLKMDLCIVGDGPLRGELRNMVRALDLDDIVDLTGSAPRHEVTARLLAADAFVLPSVTPPSGDMEASPVAISEAMATGLPIISTYHGGIPEIVTHEANGLLVREKDESALAAAMIRIARDPLLARRLGRAARDMAQRELDRDRWNDVLAERIMALASEPPGLRRSDDVLRLAEQGHGRYPSADLTA